MCGVTCRIVRGVSNSKAGPCRQACTYIAEYLYFALRSDNLLLSIVAVLYGLAVDRVNLYGSFLPEDVEEVEAWRSGAPRSAGRPAASCWSPDRPSCVVPNFSRSLESSCWLAGLEAYLEYESLLYEELSLYICNRGQKGHCITPTVWNQANFVL